MSGLDGAKRGVEGEGEVEGDEGYGISRLGKGNGTMIIEGSRTIVV